jgi:hypothetical protein
MSDYDPFWADKVAFWITFALMMLLGWFLLSLDDQWLGLVLFCD